MSLNKEEKKPNYKAYLHKIKAFAFDVDGVFTDGSVLCTENGDLLRSYNAKDGFAVRTATLKGYPVAIITGGGSDSIIKRFSGLGVEDIYLRARNKIPPFMEFCNKYGLQPEEVVFVGDDIPDIQVMNACGLAVCPSDAAEEVKAVCDHISMYPGGHGCVREIVEQTLKIHGQWDFDPNAKVTVNN